VGGGPASTLPPLLLPPLPLPEPPLLLPPLHDVGAAWHLSVDVSQYHPP